MLLSIISTHCKELATRVCGYGCDQVRIDVLYVCEVDVRCRQSSGDDLKVTSEGWLNSYSCQLQSWNWPKYILLPRLPDGHVCDLFFSGC